MNIVILNDSCEMDGGAAFVALGDARSLVRRGHRVIFFSACGTPPDDRGDIEWISLGQRAILDEPRRWKAALMGLWNWQAARALKRLLATLPYDSTVVHLHSWSKALSGSVVHVAHRQGYRLVCTLHDYFVVCPNGALYDYPTRRICTLKPMSTSCVVRNCDSRAMSHKIWRVLRQLIWRHWAGIPKNFDRVIAVSSFAAQKILSLLNNAEIM
ncbi:MAG: glycosyltransferase family 4 protein, partial [Stenotrophobium sp.]